MTNWRAPESTCPRCGHKINAAGEAHGLSIKPDPGDFSVCYGCCGILVFKDDLTPRLPTPAEELEAAHHEDLQFARQSLIGFKAWLKNST